ncbi:MAG: hypothetical protein ABIJ65_14850 [Chloroflexota bacterium]
MSEKKDVCRTNSSSIPTVKMELGEVPSLNLRNEHHFEKTSEIIQPGVEMETIVTKLITHLKNNN